MKNLVTKILLLSGTAIGFSNAAGQCPFGFDSKEDTGDLHPMGRILQAVESGPTYPSEIFTCSKANKTLQTNPDNFTVEDYESIAGDVMDQYETVEEPTRFAACLVRMAGHDFMDYRKIDGVESGGSDGCVNFNDPDNKGLASCLNATELQPIYEKTCDQVSLADFVVIAAEAVTARTATNYNNSTEFNVGTLEAKFRDNFRAGRKTNETCNETGRMPNAEAGCTDIKTVFIDHLFSGVKSKERFKWKLAAAISGAHTIGQATLNNSGFNGSWSDSDNQDVFNNDYYKSLLLKGWAPKEIDATHHQWERVDKSTDGAGQMMLSSDMCLAYLHNSEHDQCVDRLVAQGMKLHRANGKCRGLQKRGEPVNGAQTHCCAWTNSRALFNTGVFRREESNEYCGVNITAPASFVDARDHCCQGENATNSSEGDCDSSKWPKGKAFGAMLGFAQNEDNWLTFYTRAWWIATQKGHTNLGNAANPSKGNRHRRRKGGKRGKGGNKGKKRGNKSKKGGKGGKMKGKRAGKMKGKKGKRGKRGRKGN